MSKYIAKAYARITNEEKRGEVINFLEEQGFRQIGVTLSRVKDCIQIKEGFYQCRDDYWLVKDCDQFAIDCNAHTPNGTEEEVVELFLILAAMRDDTNDGKWLVWSDAPYDDIKIIRRNICYKGVAYGDENEEWQTYSYELYRDATPLEVAEAFRDGRIELLNQKTIQEI